MGRKKKEHQEMQVTLAVESEFGGTCNFEFKLICPDCGSDNIRSAGTRGREEGRVDAFKCANPDCPQHAAQEDQRKAGRQFTATTSEVVQKLVNREIETIIQEMYVGGVEATTVAAQHGVSDALVSLLRKSTDLAIERGIARDALVAGLTVDYAAAVDEFFLSIGGKAVYVILVRGYQSAKVLGVNVSFSRKEEDVRKAFDEAQGNTTEAIATVTCDAWGGTLAMGRNLGRAVTLVIHKHKKPYDKVVIKRIEYEGEGEARERVTTDIGVKSDIFTTRAKREYKIRQTREFTSKPPPRPVGRPKGSKNRPKGARKKKRAPRNRGGGPRASLPSSGAARSAMSGLTQAGAL
jgi:hypothetical protein